MSECRAITNLIGNGVATVVVSRWENEVPAARLPRCGDVRTFSLCAFLRADEETRVDRLTQLCFCCFVLRVRFQDSLNRSWCRKRNVGFESTEPAAT
jgi:hypothetical protein